MNGIDELIGVRTAQRIKLSQAYIGRGGEAKVFRTSNPNLAAKIYNSFKQERIDKLQIMLDNRPHDPMLHKGHVSIAWPQDILKNSSGEYVGFLMPIVDKGETLINIYNPQRRAKLAANFNWHYLHVTAQNIASIIEALHDKNYIVGDIKDDNFLVNSQALVSIIDTDSFQVLEPSKDGKQGKVYHCPLWSHEFTPAELIGKDLSNIDRTQFHD